ELRAALEEVEFDREAEAGDLAAKLTHQLHRRLHGAAGGEQIVDDDHALSRLDRVEMDFEGVGSVLQVVAHAGGLCRQLLRLAHGNESSVQAVRQHRAKDEAARLDAEDQVDLLADVVGRERVDHLRESALVLQQGGDVVEQNPRFGKVRHGAHKFFPRFAIDLLYRTHYHAP